MILSVSVAFLQPNYQKLLNSLANVFSGQSCKYSTIINYGSRIVLKEIF